MSNRLYKVRVGNYERIFDQANVKVREWEKTQADKFDAKLELEQSLPWPKAAIDGRYSAS